MVKREGKGHLDLGGGIKKGKRPVQGRWGGLGEKRSSIAWSGRVFTKNRAR